MIVRGADGRTKQEEKVLARLRKPVGRIYREKKDNQWRKGTRARSVVVLSSLDDSTIGEGGSKDLFLDH